MKQVTATLKLAGINIEVCSVEFITESKRTDPEVDVIILDKISERLIIDVEVKEIDEINKT